MAEGSDRIFNALEFMRSYKYRELLMVLESLLVKAYLIQHDLDVKDFIDDHIPLLNNVLNSIWQVIEWWRKGAICYVYGTWLLHLQVKLER